MRSGAKSGTRPALPTDNRRDAESALHTPKRLLRAIRVALESNWLST